MLLPQRKPQSLGPPTFAIFQSSRAERSELISKMCCLSLAFPRAKPTSIRAESSCADEPSPEELMDRQIVKFFSNNSTAARNSRLRW
eukprot:scaffold1307_cov200-Pinguiococcus_pyrenoidosus.AAC.141